MNATTNITGQDNCVGGIVRVAARIIVGCSGKCTSKPPVRRGRSAALAILWATLVAGGLFHAPAARAVVNVYSSEASWQSAVSAPTLIAFDDLAAGTVLSNQYMGATFSSTMGGIPRTSDTYTAYSGSQLVVTYPDLTDMNNGGGDINIVFDSPQGGFSFRHLDSQFANAVTLYDSADLPLGTFELQTPHPTQWAYLGFTSSSNDIARMSVTVNPLDFVGFDDLQFAAATTNQTVLVSNLQEPIRDATPIGNNPNPVDPVGLPGTPWYWAAQSFSADNQVYSLTSIDAIVGRASDSPPPVVVAELRANNAGTIGDLITTFSAPDVSGPSLARTFVPDNPVTLDPNGSYWFVLGSQDPGDGTFYWSYAEGNNFVGPGALGGYADTTESGSDWIYRGDNPYFLQVNAVPIIIVDPCAVADVNIDGAVDGADLSTIFANWGASMPGRPGNLNDDDVVDGADVAIIYGCWTGDTERAASVPEPGMCGAGAFGCLGLLLQSNRQRRSQREDASARR